MIRSIRGRLQWWYGVVYALAIIVFGSLVYWRADRDVHERATLQAVSTAQYLDVSLRNVRPREIRDPVAPNGENFPTEFSLGPLPPEFQFRPPRDRGMHGRRPPGEDRGPLPKRPDFENSGVAGGRPGGNGDQRPFGGMPSGRGPDGAGRPRPFGADGPPPRERADSIRVPQSESAPEDDGPRPPMDRMEFVVWRSDGSVLAQSAGVTPNDSVSVPAIEGNGSAPQVSMHFGNVRALMRGPFGSMILVTRPMRHDFAGLHRFGFQIAGMGTVTLLIGLLGGWWASGRIVKPIQLISETAAQISATSLDRRIETGRLDEELVQLGTVLNQTFGRLETSFGRLTQFTADASHELRTPLAIIQSQAELALSQARTPETYQQTLQVCLKSSERMSLLIDGLLLLARTDSDRLEIQRSDIDLRCVVEDVVAQLQSKAISAGLDLECITSEDPMTVCGDARFLAQVPSNLIDNAIQHTQAGGKIVVEVRRDETTAVLTVKDTGCGIASEHLPHIFERFYRVDVGRSRQHGGSGLGLAICRSLVETHGGTIAVESTIGEGSTFTVRLPLATCSDEIVCSANADPSS